MSSNTKYVLDANVFIEAHRRYYSFDLVPSFWETLLELANEDKAFSIDRVKQEIISPDKEDKLNIWARNDYAPYFMSTDNESVIKSYSEIINWAHGQNQYFEYAKVEFASVADSWIVAYALVNNCTIVTHEQFDPNIKKRIPIPNVCHVFEIPYINTFEMFRELNRILV